MIPAFRKQEVGELMNVLLILVYSYLKKILLITIIMLLYDARFISYFFFPSLA